jgi:hypothetical protein
MMILILQGDMVDALTDFEKMVSTYREVPIPLRMQYQSIFAHVELRKQNISASLDCIERAIDLIPKIHYSNTCIYTAVLLCSLALFSVVELSKQKSEKSNEGRERGKSFKEPRKRGSISPVTMPPIKLKTDYIVKAVRGIDGTVSFDYKSTKDTKLKLSAQVQKQQQHSTTMQQVKKICFQMVEKLDSFKGHSITEPFVLLLRALAKQCDSTIVNTIDGPEALRAWVTKQQESHASEMKLIVALLAIKCWSVSNESLEYTTELNIGMALLAELGLDGLSIF